MQLICQPTKCGDTVLCVNTETEIAFQRTLMINAHIFQTSPSTGNKAKSHNCTISAGRRCLLGYLLLLGTHKGAVKAMLVSSLLDVWACLENGQRSQVALMFLSNSALSPLRAWK